MKKHTHIAEIDHVDFYSPAFPNKQETREFVTYVKSLEHPAKVILHQAARMLYLAEIVHQPGRPALEVLFFLIAAEAVAKSVFNFEGEGESRRYVKRFFQEICNDKHKTLLSQAFKKQIAETGFVSDDYLTLDETIDFLYDVRCDIVHRGIYFDNLWLKEKRSDENLLFQWKNLQYISPDISTNSLRKIVLEGAVLGCRIALPDGDKYKLNLPTMK